MVRAGRSTRRGYRQEAVKLAEWGTGESRYDPDDRMAPNVI